MSLQDTKYWASLSIDGIKKALKETPSKAKKSDTYGEQLSVDVKFWDDGGASLSIWNKEKEERINIGKVMVSKNQDAFPAQKLDPPAGETAAFDSPF